MAQKRRTPNRRGRPAPENALTPKAVAEAAFALIDEQGLAGFSMRRLGQSLGVEAMALYNHFPDKDAILSAVASLALAAVDMPPPSGPWRTRIKRLCFSVRDLGKRHPNLFRLAMIQPVRPTAAFPLVEGALTAFADAGLTPARQAEAYHTCFLYTRGFCLWEIEEAQPNRAAEWAAAAASAEAFPRTAAATRLIFSPDLDRQFEAGLDLILRGLADRASKSPKSERSREKPAR